MPVIPFNPGSGNGAPTVRKRPQGSERRARRDRGYEGGGRNRAAVDADDPSRAARLEHALIDALRECAVNRARAERAERMLAEQDPPGNRG